MTDVIHIADKRRHHPPPAVTLETLFGQMDAMTLRTCVNWRAHRATMFANWAYADLDECWGHGDSGDLDTEPLSKMQACEGLLASAEPHTVIAAREMLRVALTILVHGEECPRSFMAQGPVIEILRHVIEGLDAAPDATPLKRPCGA